jgi:hypothetical protein
MTTRGSANNEAEKAGAQIRAFLATLGHLPGFGIASLIVLRPLSRRPAPEAAAAEAVTRSSARIAVRIIGMERAWGQKVDAL